MAKNFAGWVPFEGPGKLRFRRWHIVKMSPLGVVVTYCGRYVFSDPISLTKGEGAICATCARFKNVTSRCRVL